MVTSQGVCVQTLEGGKNRLVQPQRPAATGEGAGPTTAYLKETEFPPHLRILPCSSFSSASLCAFAPLRQTLLTLSPRDLAPKIPPLPAPRSFRLLQNPSLSTTFPSHHAKT